MSNLLNYLIELNIALAIFFAVYLILFKKDANFNNRRAFLLFSMGMSFLVPLLHIRFSHPIEVLNSTIISLEELIFVAGSSDLEQSVFSLSSLLPTIYFTISFFFLGKMLLSIGKIIYLHKHSKKVKLFGHIVHYNSSLHASSFFNIIFIDPAETNTETIKHILEHESHHVRLMHSIDRILAEIIICFGWINPLSWMLRKSIVVNHEYQADNRVIEEGTDQISYQLTILNQYIGSASISNQFSNQIKNRINMLNKNYRKGSFWKSFLLVPIGILLLFFMACGNENGTEDELSSNLKSEKSAEDQIFYVVEEMPQWQGKEDMSTEIRKFIAKNLYYPDAAKKSGTEGKVFVHFLVTKTGDVVIPDPSLLPPAKDDAGNIEEVVVVSYRSLDEDAATPDDNMVQLLKDEAVRVIELLPDMIPGKQRGKAVNVIFTMPITFKLQ